MAAALLGGILLLTGCAETSGSDSAAHPTTAPSQDAPAEVSGSVAPPSLPAPPPSSRSRSTAAAAPPSTRQTPASVPGCRNVTVTGEVKTAVTRAYQRGFRRLAHIEPEPRTFFYGRCGTARYAATRFQPTQGASEGELVGLQDEGGAMKYFRATSGSDWSYIATDGFPPGPGGCGGIRQIPRALAAEWRKCAIAR